MTYNFFNSHRDIVLIYGLTGGLIYKNQAAASFLSEFSDVSHNLSNLLNEFTDLSRTHSGLKILKENNLNRIELYSSKTFKVYYFELLNQPENGDLILIVKESEFDVNIYESTRQYADLQEVILDAAKQFIKIDITEVSNAINESLSKLGKLVDADRVYIFDYDFKERITSNTYEWCAEGIDPEIENLQDVPMEYVPQWVARHEKFENLYIPDVSSLSGEDESLKEILEPQGIKSLLTVPIYDNNELFGFVGFDSVNDFRVYSQKEINLLELFAQLLSDIRKREQIDKNLKLAKQEAENANKAKSDFLANMSHEIRTPMNGIIGFVELLSEKEEDPSKLEYLEIIKSSSENLMRIINDILDLSKIEAGKYKFIEEPVNFFNTFKRTTALYELQVNKKGLDYSVKIDKALDKYFISDEKSIITILNNLLSNAIKFTHKGFVGIEAELKENNSLEIIVSDSGIGINFEKQQHLFEAFVQGEHFLTKKYGGTGLGLSITKKIIDALDARIEVHTELEKGTSFLLKIPLKVSDLKIEEKTTVSSSTTLKRAIKIASAEDVEINQILIQKVLQNEPATIFKAYNGQELLYLLENQEIDLILMDMQMPVLNGLDATQIIRSNTKFDQIPIIAVSAFAFEENIKEMLKAGANDYLTKPIKKGDLIEKINQWIS
jgi:signal transduction histidine kinase